MYVFNTLLFGVWRREHSLNSSLANDDADVACDALQRGIFLVRAVVEKNQHYVPSQTVLAFIVACAAQPLDEELKPGTVGVEVERLLVLMEEQASDAGSLSIARDAFTHCASTLPRSFPTLPPCLFSSQGRSYVCLARTGVVCEQPRRASAHGGGEQAASRERARR